MGSPAAKRLLKEFKIIQNHPTFGVSAAPQGDNILLWQGVIFGAAGTAYEDGIFKLEMVFPEEYPLKAPRVRFISQMFHPNVYADGRICIDVLQNQWSPSYGVAAILVSIQSLLNDPNIRSPANEDAAKLYSGNRREYIKRVQKCVAASLSEDDDMDNDKDKL